jgi:F0F1-type ATP synthase delta subunit
MNNKIQSINTQELFNTIYTKDELLLFYHEIDQLIADLFTGKQGVQEKMNELLSFEKKKNIMYYLTAMQINMGNIVMVKEALAKIQTLGNKIPVVTLQLAFEPTEPIIASFSFWFIKNFGTKVILDIHLERKIIGGALISLNGKYDDFTLETKIDTYFNKI